MASELKITEQAVDVSIEKMVYGGEGLSRTPEGVLLVPGVIAGERVRVLPAPARRGVRRGELLELIESSAERTMPGCPHYARCGGCQYQHMGYAAQLELKKQILAECFERIGKFRLEVPIQTLPSEPWHYRNRVRLQIEKNGSDYRVGYLEHASHTLVSVDTCPIAAPSLEAVIAVLSKGTLGELFPDGTCELELFTNESGRSSLATFYASLPAPPSFGDAWRTALPGFESVCWTEQAASRGHDLTTRETVWGSGALTYRVGEFHYRVSHHSFFQANQGLLQPMIDAAMGNHAGGRALDLYAGVGFFTLPLARKFEKVAAVEMHPASARDLAANAGVMGTRVHAHHKTAEGFIAAASRNWDMVLVDPPRAGLAKPVVEGLQRLSARRLVYVSCDPTTLARDLAALRAAKYQIESVHLVDQFPQTFHIETIVHLVHSG